MTIRVRCDAVGLLCVSYYPDMSRTIVKARCWCWARRADSLAVSESYKTFTILVNTPSRRRFRAASGVRARMRPTVIHIARARACACAGGPRRLVIPVEEPVARWLHAPSSRLRSGSAGVTSEIGQGAGGLWICPT